MGRDEIAMFSVLAMKSGIYKITNTMNGNCYVGSAVNIAHRWYEHRCDLRGGRHHGKMLQRAFSKYGMEVLSFSKLLLCAPEHLLFYEQRAIDILKPEYNCAKVAGSQLGMKHSPETITKLKERRKHQIRPPCSLETKAKISKANTGKRYVGRLVSAETRAKLSAIRKASPLTPKQMEARRMKGVRSRGVTLTPEHRERARAGVIAWWKKRKLCAGVINQ